MGGLTRKPLLNRDIFEPYELTKIGHIDGVDHNESISVGPQGEAYTTGFITFRVFRMDLKSNKGEAFATTAPRCILDTPWTRTEISTVPNLTPRTAR